MVSCTSILAAPAPYRVPIYSGYDLLAGQASYSATTNLPLLGYTNFSGYWYQSNYTGSTVWNIPSQQFYNSGASNIVVSFNLFSTNGLDMGAHALVAYIRIVIYTNQPLAVSGTLSSGDPTNLFKPYYDSGDKQSIIGVFRNGTNIQSIVLTNSIATNILANTNIAFGTVSFCPLVVGGNYGSLWLLNGRMNLRP